MSSWIISINSTSLIFLKDLPLSCTVVTKELTPRATLTFSPSLNTTNSPASIRLSKDSRSTNSTPVTSGSGAKVQEIVAGVPQIKPAIRDKYC